MYADRNARSGLNPASLGMAVLVNGGAIAALLLAQPVITLVRRDPPITIYSVPLDPVPDPVPPPKPHDAKPLPKQAVDASRPVTPTPSPDAFPIPDNPPLPFPDTGAGTSAGTGDGTGAVAIPLDPPKPPPPVMIGPSVDERFARDLQPPYPPSERRAGREGRVVVRILVGVDGRVKDIEQVSATSDAFLQATIAQARRKWRFKPATRDGVPVEGWRTMALTFVLRDDD